MVTIKVRGVSFFPIHHEDRLLTYNTAECGTLTCHCLSFQVSEKDVRQGIQMRTVFYSLLYPLVFLNFQEGLRSRKINIWKQFRYCTDARNTHYFSISND